MKFLYTVFLWMLLLPVALGGGLPDGTDALTNKLSSLHSFSASFKQQVLDLNNSLIQSAEGKLDATKQGTTKGKLRWHSLAPMEQLIVADGERIWLYDPDLLQVVVQAYPEDLARTPAMLLVGETAGLADQYEVSILKDQDQSMEFMLIPRDADSLYSRITIGFNDNTPVAMSLQDSLLQTTVIEFSNVVLNHDPEPALFHFDVPDGVDLIRND